MSLCLTEEEIVELTKKERFSAQARQLRSMDIPFRPRSDGSLAVLRIHVETIAGSRGGARLAPEPQLRLPS